jgi:hypothetical protein
MAQKPLVEQLEADLGSRANVLRVSIHTDMGQELGQRYNFQSTPLFIVFDARGNQSKREGRAPTVAEVLGEG